MNWFREVMVPVPCKDEQHKIVEYLSRVEDNVNRLKDLQTKMTNELENLLPSILDKFFKGDL
jgi:type I restriction enzyme, S subunit